MKYKDLIRVFSASLILIIISELLMFYALGKVSHLLNLEQFGDFQVFISGLGTIGSVLLLGFSIFMAKYLPNLYLVQRKKEWQQIKTFYLKYFCVSIVLLIIIMLISWVLYFIFDKDDFGHPLLLFLIFVFLETFFQIIFTFFKSKSYYVTSVTMFTTKNIAFLLMIIIINGNLHLIIFDYIVAYFIVYIYVLIISKFFKIKSKKLNHDIKSVMPISWKTYIFPYTLLNINPYLFSAIPLILFEILSPNEDSVGLFGAVIALFSVSMIGIYPLRTFIVNELAKALYQKNFFEVFKRLLFFSIGLSIILGIILWVTGPYLIMIFSTKYIEILSYYQAIIPTILMMTINGVFFSILKIEDQSEKFIIISIISALVIIVTSSYVLSNYYDLYGAILAIDISYALYLLICIYFSYILVKKRVTISKVG